MGIVEKSSKIITMQLSSHELLPNLRGGGVVSPPPPQKHWLDFNVEKTQPDQKFLQILRRGRGKNTWYYFLNHELTALNRTNRNGQQSVGEKQS
jgi:hypothetical protein